MRDADDIKKLQAGLSTVTKGWTRTLEEEKAQLEAEIAGLASIVYNPVGVGEPGAFMGTRLFEPESFSFTLDTDQDNTSDNAVNYVVRDGQQYNIEIPMSGPGVFVAEYFQVAVWQRFFVPDANQAFWYPVSTLIPYHATANRRPWTTLFSVYPQQPQTTSVNIANSFDQAYRQLNYFWNLLDPRSGRRLSDNLMSHLMLLPRLTPMITLDGFGSQAPATARDGGLFQFRTPWLFERDSQLTFVFRPITPILQFDSALAGTDAAVGLPYDDRENGRRDQSVLVQAEVHGHRFQTAQDAIKAGALVTR